MEVDPEALNRTPSPEKPKAQLKTMILKRAILGTTMKGTSVARDKGPYHRSSDPYSKLCDPHETYQSIVGLV